MFSLKIQPKGVCGTPVFKARGGDEIVILFYMCMTAIIFNARKALRGLMFALNISSSFQVGPVLSFNE